MSMDPSFFQWLQQPQSMHNEPSQNSQRTPTLTASSSSSLDEWAKDRPVVNGQTGASSSSHTTTAPMDISDIMSDIAGSSNAASSLSTSAPFYYTPANNYYVHAPYNAIQPYATSAWQNSASHVPLSNYSSLNGATTSLPTSSSTPVASTSNPSQQSQHSTQQSLQNAQPKPQQSHQTQQPTPMVIDPALTTLSRPANGTQPYQTPRTFYQHLTPSYPVPQYYTSSQQHAAPQGTLSPQALHAPTTASPSSSLMGNVVPAQFYPPYQQTPNSATASSSNTSTPPNPPPPTLTPQERKAQLTTSIRPLLTPNSFTGAQAVQSLAQRISDYGLSDVDGSTRTEILTKIRDGAGNPYFRAWAENSTAMDITREWLKSSAKDGDQAIMPLLHLIDRLPLTLDSLKASKLGKLVVKLVKDPPNPAVKDMASNIERRWRQMVNDEAKPTDDEEGPSKVKKRKLTEAPSKSVQPLKKPAVGTVSSTKPVAVKKEVKSAAPAKDAKSDLSFFSAKTKPKLPTFKKAPVVTVKKEENVAQPSAVDAFQEVLMSMKKSPAAPTPPPATPTPTPIASNTPPLADGLVPGSRKRKRVSWAPEGRLESIKIIERAVYDDDPTDGSIHHSLRDLDRSEGRALHTHLFEETMDWSEPIGLEFPDIEVQIRGEGSSEKVTQEAREQAALSALYMTPNQIPDSPAEPSSVMSEEEVDKDVHTMTPGEEIQGALDQPMPIPPPPVNFSSVAELIAQLGPAVPGGDNKLFNPATNPVLAGAIAAGAGVTPQQVQDFFGGGYGGQPGAQYDQNWSGVPQNQFEQPQPGYHEDQIRWAMDSRGRGGARGRGRGRGHGREDGYRGTKRKPCTFYQSGRCKFGDQCDYLHEKIAQ